MADIKIMLTYEEYRALVKRATDERRSPNDMAAYIVVKALQLKKPAARKAKPKAAS